ncbi:Oidioi.mRNA.OKI2018_I69.chr2.g4907.t1.cds [Oikopleura dioica]|uniref:Oidioi.mRNA.OKI2018_I69.chr2.g4907.t1.cds n=1 Tax=Oikopleura dioica TaxID=34765 RepID=A0ABN7T4H7_OIKDI|nr:Oidioi.mRNA.OKI2018_I69.chr2.g4907.t1.cds [Oikopleura dioica]
MMMIWAISGVYVNAFVEIYLHETVFGPNQLEYEPLWDIYELFGEERNGIDGLFSFTERAMLFFLICYIFLLALSPNRQVIIRRFCFLGGLIYFYRALFISVTTLPPTRKLVGECSRPQTSGTIGELLIRTFFFVLTGGFKMNQDGNNICGGYLFSGHTSIIILFSRFVCNYSSKKLPRSFKYGLKVLEVLSIVCIILAHEHYTIDIITAWFLMTREMWIYTSLLQTQDENLNENIALTNVWWSSFFEWIEEDLPRDEFYLPKENF